MFNAGRNVSAVGFPMGSFRVEPSGGNEGSLERGRNMGRPTAELVKCKIVTVMDSRTVVPSRIGGIPPSFVRFFRVVPCYERPRFFLATVLVVPGFLCEASTSLAERFLRRRNYCESIRTGGNHARRRYAVSSITRDKLATCSSTVVPRGAESNILLSSWKLGDHSRLRADTANQNEIDRNRINVGGIRISCVIYKASLVPRFFTGRKGSQAIWSSICKAARGTFG